MRERTVEQHFRHRVKKAGGEQRKFVSPGRRGVGDRIALWPGALCDFVELKAPGKKAKPHQTREAKRMVRLGFATFVLDTKARVDWYIDMRKSKCES